MSFTQLDPALPVEVIGKGKGYAIGMIDYGQEHNLIWVTALDESGEIWCAPNPKVRMQTNWTMGRMPVRESAACRCEGEHDRDAHSFGCKGARLEGALGALMRL